MSTLGLKTEETGREEYLRKEVHGDDPAKSERLAFNGRAMVTDEVFDDSKLPKTKPRKTSPLFEQLISDTREHLKNIGAIKDE